MRWKTQHVRRGDVNETEKLRQSIEAAQHTLAVGRLSHLCDCDTFAKFGEHSPKCAAEIAAAKA